MTRYEDTVQPESAPCACGCGENVDELDAVWLGGERYTEVCALEKVEREKADREGASFGPKDADEIAGEAYQVIGALAHRAGLFDHPAVQRALDYFSSDLTGEVLPFKISGGQPA